jgi:hypothetical protein
VRGPIDLDDVIGTEAHPWGAVEVPLAHWIVCLAAHSAARPAT